nr:DNA polymerase III subunit gamma/tau [Desulfobulbaceae bacterium]
MSYLVLARKWRPQNFDDVVGQKPVVQTLRNALSRDRVAHAMIFSGVRGVGKTTIARIMAKALNCHNPEKAPCDLCSSCKEIKSGQSIDLHEIDGASNRGIQEIRDLKENLRFLPASERFKVIIIDEVHMLTTEAFNALLKTLEEPPEHVYFMFATTELHKVPVTILSRCQRYELKRIPFQELKAFFAKIAAIESVSISDGALEIIATEADGSVRDGLSLLDQIFSFGGETVTEKDLRQVLGLVDRKIFVELATELLSANLALALKHLNDSYSQGMDVKRFAQGLLYCFRSLIICAVSKEPEAILDVSDAEMTALKKLAGTYTSESLISVFDILLKGVEALQYSTQPRMALEMCFVKAVQSSDIVPVTTLLSRLDALIAGCPAEIIRHEPLMENVEVKSEPVPEDHAAEVDSSAVTQHDVTPVPVATPEKVSDECLDDDYDDSDQTIDESEPELKSLQAKLSSPVPKDVVREWDGFIGHVRERKKWMGSTLGLAEKVREIDGQLVIKFDEQSECLYLQDPANLKLLTEFAQDFFQKEMAIKIEVAGLDGVVDGGEGQPQEERRALAKDPRVQIAVEVLGGQIAGIRTGPRSR